MLQRSVYVNIVPKSVVLLSIVWVIRYSWFQSTKIQQQAFNSRLTVYQPLISIELYAEQPRFLLFSFASHITCMNVSLSWNRERAEPWHEPQRWIAIALRPKNLLRQYFGWLLFNYGNAIKFAYGQRDAICLISHSPAQSIFGWNTHAPNPKANLCILCAPHGPQPTPASVLHNARSIVSMRITSNTRPAPLWFAHLFEIRFHYYSRCERLL